MLPCRYGIQILAELLKAILLTSSYVFFNAFHKYFELNLIQMCQFQTMSDFKIVQLLGFNYYYLNRYYSKTIDNILILRTALKAPFKRYQ